MRRTIRERRGVSHRVTGWLAATLVCLCLAPVGASAAAGGKIVDIPVRFAIDNGNSSRVACAADGQRYVVGGHLVGPRDALAGGRARTVSIYLHGLDVREWFWRFDRVPGYDFA